MEEWQGGKATKLIMNRGLQNLGTMNPEGGQIVDKSLPVQQQMEQLQQQ